MAPTRSWTCAICGASDAEVESGEFVVIPATRTAPGRTVAWLCVECVEAPDQAFRFREVAFEMADGYPLLEFLPEPTT